MIECPDCGGHNTTATVYLDGEGGALYVEWHCGDCGAEWIEDDDEEEGEA